SFIPGTVPLVSTQGTLKLSTAGDQAAITAYFQLPPNQTVPGLSLTFSIGGLTRTFRFDFRGRATSQDGSARLRVQRFKGRGSLAKLTVNLKGDLRVELAAGSALNADGLPAQTLVRVDVPGLAFTAVVPLVFKKTRAGSVAK